MIKLLPFTLNIPSKANFRAIGTSYKVNPFINLKALLNSQPARLEEVTSYILEIIEYFKTKQVY